MHAYSIESRAELSPVVVRAPSTSALPPQPLASAFRRGSSSTLAEKARRCPHAEFAPVFRSGEEDRKGAGTARTQRRNKNPDPCAPCALAVLLLCLFG